MYIYIYVYIYMWLHNLLHTVIPCAIRMRIAFSHHLRRPNHSCFPYKSHEITILPAMSMAELRSLATISARSLSPAVSGSMTATWEISELWSLTIWHTWELDGIWWDFHGFPWISDQSMENETRLSKCCLLRTATPSCWSTMRQQREWTTIVTTNHVRNLPSKNGKWWDLTR